MNGTADDKTKEFTFTVTLGDTTINDTYGDMTFVNGVAVFKLKHEGTAKAAGLPANITYTVVESDNEGYEVTKTGDTGTISASGPSIAAFTNTRGEYGSLEVSKTVTGNGAELTKDFTFTVTLDDNTVNGEYGDMTFADGVAAFTLKHLESKMATGLPAGVGYTVTETADENYTTVSTGSTGTISGSSPSIAGFVNTHKTGDLTIRKTVEGTGADLNKEFSFTVTLSDAAINGVYGDMLFVNGAATVMLKHGESSTAKDLPSGITYEVEESGNEGYRMSQTGGSGTITADAAEARFTNTLMTGGLTVSKTVTGVGADYTRDFTFTVTLSDDAINGEYGDMTFTNGAARFTLRHDESRTAADLPAGITYEVVESDNEGYTMSGTGIVGMIIENRVVAASIINDAAPPYVPNIPDRPNIPNVPNTPDNPNVPNTPDVSGTPNVPETLPAAPDFEISNPTPLADTDADDSFDK